MHSKNKAINNLKKLIGVNDNLLIIFDKTTRSFALDLSKQYDNPILFNLDDYKRPIIKVPKKLKELMPKSEGCLLCVKKVADNKNTELTFRVELTNFFESSNKKVGTLLSIPSKLLYSLLDVNISSCVLLTDRIHEYLLNKKSIRITSDNGTNLVVDVYGCKWVKSTGFVIPKLSRNAFPSEVYTWPKQVNGIMVCNGSYGYLNYLKEFDKKILFDNPITLEIVNSKIISIKCENSQLKEIVTNQIYSCENADRIGEIGFGTNLSLQKPTGILMVDEKIPGVHIAHGHGYPQRTGAPYQCKIHYDFVLLNTTVYVDEQIFFNKNFYCL